MGEFSMQVFYLFVYILVVCESLPVVTEENTKELYNDDAIRETNTAKLLSEVTDKQTPLGLNKFEILNKLQPSLLRNISRDVIGQIKTIADNVIHFIKESIITNPNPIKEFKMTLGNGDIKSTNNDTSAPNEIHSNSMVVDGKVTKVTNTQYRTSPLLEHRNSKVSRERLKNKARVPGHRKYRQKRSNDWWSIGFGLDTGFEDDSTDVIFGAHTSPCAHADRHYCLNGGTCVFLGALEIKTCRCSIGYTGLRCEMINQEYILALLSNEFFG